MAPTARRGGIAGGRQGRWSDSTARRKPARTCSASWFGRIVVDERGLPAERRADRERAAPRPGVVLGRGERREADREAPVLLADQPGQRAGERGPEVQERRLGRRAGGRADLAEAHDALVVRDPEHGEPPVVGAVDGPRHAGQEAAVADADLLLAQERGAGVRESFGHRRRGYRPATGPPSARGGGRRAAAPGLRRSAPGGAPGLVGRELGRPLRRGRRGSRRGRWRRRRTASGAGSSPSSERWIPRRASSSAFSATGLGDEVGPLGLELQAEHLAAHLLGRRREDLGAGRGRRCRPAPRP